MNASTVLVHWTRSTLRELATINYGRNPSAILHEDGQYPVYGTSGRERYGTSHLYEGESIILGRKGTIDRIHFATGRFWTIDTAYFLSQFTDVQPKWLYYFLSCVDLRAFNEATGVPSISRDRLYKIIVERPPGPEQAKISEVLSTVDRAIEQTEALIAKQQRIKTGLMQDLLTRGIDEHGNLRSEQTHEFKDSPLGRIPVEWDVVPVGSLLSAIQGGWSPSCIDEPPGEGEWGVLKVSAVSSGIYDPSESKRLPQALTPIPALEVRSGDVLLCRSNGVAELVGRCVFVEHTPSRLLLSDKTLRLRPISSRVNRSILAILLMSHSSRIQVMAALNGSSGQKNISQPQIRSIQVRLPALPEQERIQSVLAAAFRVLRTNCESLDKLRNIKMGLMQDLLTGNRLVAALLELHEAVTE